MLRMKRTTIWLLLLQASALACSFFPPVHKVSRTFSVLVKNDLGPVAGLKLKVSFFKWDEYNALTDEQRRSADLSAFEEIVAESSTDDTGTARFNLARIGAFTLSPDSPANQLDWVELEVSDQHPDFRQIEFHWPSVAVLRAAYLRGRLSRGLFSTRNLPLKHMQLRLHTLIDYRQVDPATTGEDGSFDFKGIAPGLYFLQLVDTSESSNDFYKTEGDIAVYVAPDNSRDRLMISTENTSCGLSYDLDENKARYKPIACFKGAQQVTCDWNE